MTVKWGVLLPTFDPLGSGTFPVTAAARRAEQLGFDAVWAGDHLAGYPPVLDSLCASVARQGAERLTRAQYRTPLAKVERWTAYGPAGRVAAMLGEYVAAGVSEFVLMPAGGEPLREYERLAAARDLMSAAAE